MKKNYYYTRVSMDVVITANSAEEANNKLSEWLDGQQLIDKSTESDFWWDNIDWTDWTISEARES